MKIYDMIPRKCPKCGRVLLSDSELLDAVKYARQVKCVCRKFGFRMSPIYFIFSKVAYKSVQDFL